MVDLLVSDNNAACMNALMRAGARFLIVGGLAVHVYKPDRNIIGVDVDLLVDRQADNAALVERIVSEHGGAGQIKPAALTRPKVQQETGYRLNMELLTLADGEDFDALWQDATDATANGVPVRVIGLAGLKRMKERAALESATPDKHRDDLALLAQVPAKHKR